MSIHVVTRRSFTADDMQHALDEFWAESARDPGLQRRLRALGLSDAELESARSQPSTVTQSAAGFDATAIVIVLTPVVARVTKDVWEQIILPWLKAKYGPDVTKEQDDEPDAR